MPPSAAFAIAASLAAADAPPPSAQPWHVEENGPAECLALIRPTPFGRVPIRVGLDIEGAVGIEVDSRQPRPAGGEALAIGGRLYRDTGEGWDLGEGEEFLAALAAAPAVELRTSAGATVDRLSLAGFAEALPRLRGCTAALKAKVDAERAQALRAEAKPLPEPSGGAPSLANLAALVSDKDYPAFALRDEIEGTVGFRLRIATDGRVSGCTVTSSSGSLGLDVHTCRLMRQRARFRPATDARGRPVEDSISSRLTWRISAD